MTRTTLSTVTAFIVALITFCAPARAEMPRGCYPAILQQVVDGDTVMAFYGTSEPSAWVFARIRIRGIDTPEKPISKRPGKTWPAKCMAEAVKGKEASAYLIRKLTPFVAQLPATRVRVCQISPDKYHGRRVATVEFRTSEGWQDVGRMMLRAGLAFEYYGRKKPSWCACLEAGDCPKGYEAPP